jgi:hypothetical protein
MNNIIEINTTNLVNLSKKLWNTISSQELAYDNGTAIIDGVFLSDKDVAQAKKEVPWISGKLCFIIVKPNSACPIHKDNHEDGMYQRSFNILVTDESNHTTRYYNDNLEKIFEFTLNKPTVFYNQINHDVYNYGNTSRVTAMWLVEPSVTENTILQWCNAAKVGYNVVY